MQISWWCCTVTGNLKNEQFLKCVYFWRSETFFFRYSILNLFGQPINFTKTHFPFFHESFQFYTRLWHQLKFFEIHVHKTTPLKLCFAYRWVCKDAEVYLNSVILFPPVWKVPFVKRLPIMSDTCGVVQFKLRMRFQNTTNIQPFQINIFVINIWPFDRRHSYRMVKKVFVTIDKLR